MMAERAFIPDAEQFRVWLKDAITRVGVRPSRLAQDAGVAVNSGSKFLSGDQRDLRLETASRLFAQIHLLAVRRGVKPPPFINGDRFRPLTRQRRNDELRGLYQKKYGAGGR